MVIAMLIIYRDRNHQYPYFNQQNYCTNTDLHANTVDDDADGKEMSPSEAQSHK